MKSSRAFWCSAVGPERLANEYRSLERECGRGRAFTLLELLVVLGVIGLLAGLLLPVLSRARAAAKGTACMSNLHQIGLALQLYVQDHDNRLPVMYDALISTNPPAEPPRPTVDLVLSNYLGSPQVLRCPADDRRLFEQTKSSYAWNSLLNGQPAEQLHVFGLQFDPHQIPLMFDKEAFHRARGKGRGVNYLYADGRIQNLLVLEGTRAP